MEEKRAVQVDPRLAYTGMSGDVYVVPATGAKPQRLTWEWEPGQSFARSRSIYVWPMWSPDSRQVACFSLKGGPGPAMHMGLYVMTADGIESWQLCSLTGALPIYGNWSPDGEQIAALLQRGGSLSLELFHLGQPGNSSLLLSGSPLFWTWSPLGRYGAAHVGGSYRSSPSAWTLLFDGVSGKVVEELSARPGEFRAPHFSPDGSHLAYVAQGNDGYDALHLFAITNGEKKRICTTEGLTTFLWSPDSRHLAFGCATQRGPFLFSGLHLLDVYSQNVRQLLAEEVAAFFWSPRGDRLLYLGSTGKKSYLQWHSLDLASGEKTHLATFLPSREQVFVFSFFDQYASSHPLISPDGAYLVLAGQLIGEDTLEAANAPQVYVLPLDGSSSPRVVGEGHFACWNLTTPARK